MRSHTGAPKPRMKYVWGDPRCPSAQLAPRVGMCTLLQPAGHVLVLQRTSVTACPLHTSHTWLADGGGQSTPATTSFAPEVWHPHSSGIRKVPHHHSSQGRGWEAGAAFIVECRATALGPHGFVVSSCCADTPHLCAQPPTRYSATVFRKGAG